MSWIQTGVYISDDFFRLLGIYRGGGEMVTRTNVVGNHPRECSVNTYIK